MRGIQRQVCVYKSYVEGYPRLARGPWRRDVLGERQRVRHIIEFEPDDGVAGRLEPSKKSVGVGQSWRDSCRQNKEGMTVHGE